MKQEMRLQIECFTADCYWVQMPYGQSDQDCYLNLTLLLCNYRKLLNAWHVSAHGCFSLLCGVCEIDALVTFSNVVLQNKKIEGKLKSCL